MHFVSLMHTCCATGDVEGAGTDAEVVVEIEGQLGSYGPHQLHAMQVGAFLTMFILFIYLCTCLNYSVADIGNYKLVPSSCMPCRWVQL